MQIFYYVDTNKLQYSFPNHRVPDTLHTPVSPLKPCA